MAAEGLTCRVLDVRACIGSWSNVDGWAGGSDIRPLSEVKVMGLSEVNPASPWVKPLGDTVCEAEGDLVAVRGAELCVETLRGSGLVCGDEFDVSSWKERGPNCVLASLPWSLFSLGTGAELV